MGSTPLILRCPACVRRQWLDRDGLRRGPAATHLRHLACELRVHRARARRTQGHGAVHRALVECLHCGRTFLSSHHRFAVTHDWWSSAPCSDACRARNC